MAKKKTIRKVCDTLWSEVVKKRASYLCEYCGSNKKLQSHHIIPRTCYSLRYDLKNAACLCYRCHFYVAHKDIILFMDWVIQNRDIEYLNSRRFIQTKTDYQKVKTYLEKELEK